MKYLLKAIATASLLTLACTSIAAEKTYNSGSGKTKAEACADAKSWAEYKANDYCKSKGGNVSGALYSCDARKYKCEGCGWTAKAKVKFECR